MLTRIWQGVLRDVREHIGIDHPGTGPMVKLYFLGSFVVIATTFGLGMSGCGGGQTGGSGGIFAGIGNKPGPWPMALHVNAGFPRRPTADPVPADPGFRILVQLNQDPAQVILTGGYDGNGQTDAGWADMRPGQHVIRVWMERADGVSDPALPSQAITVGITNQGVFSPSDRLNVQLQAN